MTGTDCVRFGAIGGPYAVLVGTSLLAMSLAATQIMPASVLSLIMADLDVEPALASSLVSLTLLTPALLALPVGFALDRVDNRLVLFVGTILMVVANLWSYSAAVSGAYLELMVTRLFTGAGIALTWTAGANIVSATFKDGNTATVTGIYTASAPLGFVVGQAIPPLVATHTDWKVNFLVFATASGLSFVFFVVTGYRTAAIAETEDTANWSDFHHVLTNRGVWVVALMSFAGYSLNLFFNSWMPTYLSEELGYGLAASSVMVALFPAMGVLSRTSGGVISDRFLDSRRRPVPLLSFIVTVLLVITITVARGPVVLAVLMLLSGYFVQLSIGLFYTHVTELVDEHVAGSSIAVLTMASFTGGFTAPIIAGWLIEQTGGYVATFGYAFALAVMGVALAWFVKEP